MEEIYHLQCRICQKEFPKYDQRGFRNSGFTTHQNRCIEKEYLLNTPVSEKQTSTKPRLILPAPLCPSSSTSSSTHIILNASSSPIIPAVQQNMPMLQSQQSQQYFQPVQQTEFHYNNVDSFIQRPAGFFIVNSNQAENIEFSLFSHDGFSFPGTANNEMIFPITHCVYCSPEFELHQSSCLLLAQILHQQQPPR